MSRFLLPLTLIAVLVAFQGCVTRELYITSDPEGAAVLINDTYRGTTPMTHSFVHYQTFGIRLQKEGYHPLYVEEKISAPLYEKPGIDFVSEALVPKQIKDRRELHYSLKKNDNVDDLDEVLKRAAAKREEVKGAAEAAARRGAERESVSLPLPLKEGAKEQEEEAREEEQAEAPTDAPETAADGEGADGDK